MALHPIVYTILYIVQSPIEKENMSLPKTDQRLRVREIKRGSVKKAFMYSVFRSTGSKCIDKVRA